VAGFPERVWTPQSNGCRECLTVKRDGQSFQVDISDRHRPQRPSRNCQLGDRQTYLEGVKGEEFYGRDERLDSLRKARAEVESDLATKLKEQTQISQALGVAVISTEGGSD
jgi:hypothetical protein